MSTLNPKQSRFADEYLVDLNATQAAIRAGYSAKTAKQQGQRLLTNVDVEQAIQERMHARQKRTELNQDFVLQGIAKNIARCEQAAPVLDREGNPVIIDDGEGNLAAAYKYDATNALKGYELIGKHFKMFTDKVDHSSEDGSMSPKNVSDDELDARIAELAKQVGHGK